MAECIHRNANKTQYLLIIQGNHLGKRRHHSLFTEHNPLPTIDYSLIYVSLPVPPLHPRLHSLLFSAFSDMLTQTLQDACSPNAYLDYIKKEGVSLKKRQLRHEERHGPTNFADSPPPRSSAKYDVLARNSDHQLAEFFVI